MSQNIKVHALIDFLEQILIRMRTDTIHNTIVNILMFRFYKRLKERSILLERKLNMTINFETALDNAKLIMNVIRSCNDTFSNQLLQKSGRKFRFKISR